jgi:hypothetical protein
MEMGNLPCWSMGAGRVFARLFESMAVAAKEGKKALAHLLAKAKHAA